MEKKTPPEPIPDPRVKMKDIDATEKGTVLSLKIDRKKFADREILKDIELRIESRDRILLSGPNGSGKTTLLNIIAGDDTDFEGKRNMRENTNVGYLRQFSSLDEKNNVLDEFGKRTALEYTTRRSVLAKYLFPEEFMETTIKNLSYGQQRRLEIAILLTNSPSLLLLDEPTNHLDIFLREDLERFLLEQNVAMCIISHDTYFIDKIGITRTVELK
jgi:ATP-binding cassette subfamily F protein 3